MVTIKCVGVFNDGLYGLIAETDFIGEDVRVLEHLPKPTLKNTYNDLTLYYQSVEQFNSALNEIQVFNSQLLLEAVEKARNEKERWFYL